MADRLTTNQGTPVPDNQNSLTAGQRGPSLLADYHLVEKLARFDRERIPERVVHARGATAFGVFHPVPGLNKWTKAAMFTQDPETPVAVRFSTVIHSRHSPETLRDPRGFAVKFYTSDGNYDLVGNNLPVFFIRDAIKFPDVIHAFKPDPVTGIQDPNRIFDFLSFTPESTHMLTWLFSDRGIPRDYRHMEGFGVHTFIWINDKGEQRYVKYHWKPLAGVESLTLEEAQQIQATDFNNATKDLYTTLRDGGVAEWDLYVQLMNIADEVNLPWDPLDATKTWPEDQYVLQPVGRMTLTRAPLNDFAENEQIAFTPSATVPGIELSADKLLQGRAFSYPDTQRHRLGANYLQLAVNRPRIAVHNGQQDGPMAFEFSQSHVNYEPNTLGENLQTGAPLDYPMPVYGTVTRQKIERTDDFTQAGERWRTFDERYRLSVVKNLGDELAKVTNAKIADTIVGFMTQADPVLGDGVARRARGELPDPSVILPREQPQEPPQPPEPPQPELVTTPG